MMAGGTSQLENKAKGVYSLIPEDFKLIKGFVNHHKRCMDELKHMQGIQVINYQLNKKTLNPSKKDIDNFCAKSVGTDMLLAGYNCLIGTGIVGAVLGAIYYLKN